MGDDTTPSRVNDQLVSQIDARLAEWIEGHSEHLRDAAAGTLNNANELKAAAPHAATFISLLVEARDDPHLIYATTRLGIPFISLPELSDDLQHWLAVLKDLYLQGLRCSTG